MIARHPLARALVVPPLGRTQTLVYARAAAPLLAPTLTLTPDWEHAQQRRLLGRSTLQEADQHGVEEFASRLRQRQARFLELSQAKFETEERQAQLKKALENGEVLIRSVSEKVVALQNDLALAQTQYQISRALASPANDTLLTPDDPVKVAAEVARLKEAKLRAEVQVDSLGVRRAKVLWPGGVPPRNPRVLYAASRDVLKVLCDALEAQIVQEEVSAENRRLQILQDREDEIHLRVAQRLEGLRSRDETFNLRLDQEESLSQILLAEALPTRRAASVSSQSQGQGVAPAPRQEGAQSLLLPSLAPVAKTLSPALAAEIRAAVLDVAQRRGIRVSFSPLPGVPDRTAEFANWIKVRL